MRVKKWMIAVAFLLLISPLHPIQTKAAENEGNNYPIVFVHGLGGWGEDEFAGYPYWGGTKDVIGHLNKLGFEAYQATVSPVSSNYDRSVELYYYIKGGTVDYGAAHAEEHGHARYGRTFPGIYPEWDENHPIHLVGHSMGGLTIRGVIDLLVDGSEEEIAYHQAHPDEAISPLFEGGKSWVHSATSIGTPHNGSTFADDENRIIDFIKDFVLNISTATGISKENFLYDFKLDQWGIRRQAGETFTSYLNRVMNSRVWDSEDISVYDLSTPGAAVLNEEVDTKSDVYYFSYTGQSTKASLVTGHHRPIVSSHPIVLAPSTFIGKFTRDNPANGPIIDESWWPNDGFVSTISSLYPTGQPHTAYDSSPEKGVWNYHPIKNTWDHLDFIGIFSLSTHTKPFNVYPLYEEIANNVTSLQQ